MNLIRSITVLPVDYLKFWKETERPPGSPLRLQPPGQSGILPLLGQQKLLIALKQERMIKQIISVWNILLRPLLMIRQNHNPG